MVKMLRFLAIRHTLCRQTWPKFRQKLSFGFLYCNHFDQIGPLHKWIRVSQRPVPLWGGNNYSLPKVSHSCPCRLFREHWVINLPRADFKGSTTQKSRFLRENRQKSLKNRQIEFLLTESELQNFRLAIDPLKSAIGKSMSPFSRNNRHGHE